MPKEPLVIDKKDYQAHAFKKSDDRWYIKYYNTERDEVIETSLSWFHEEGAQKVVDHILNVNPKLQIL